MRMLSIRSSATTVMGLLVTGALFTFGSALPREKRISPSPPLAALPLAFEPAAEPGGQSFLARSRGVTTLLGPDGVRFLPDADTAKVGDGQQPALEMRLIGARVQPLLRPQSPLRQRVNYLIGNDPLAWRTDVPTYAEVVYPEVYPGVDLVFHGARGALEYDFVVRPGGCPEQVRVEWRGAEGGRVTASGGLQLDTRWGEIQQQPPTVFQLDRERRLPIAGRFTLVAAHPDSVTTGFSVGNYDRGRPLVIDPVLEYATFLGGPSHEDGGIFGEHLAVDAAGAAYVTGATGLAEGFPVTTGALRTSSPATPVTFVSKLNPEGTGLVYSTFLGGSHYEIPHAIAVDQDGSVVVAGETASSDFPTTPDVVQGARAGTDSFIARLNPAGNGLTFGTYFGALDANTYVYSVALDPQGKVWVGGASQYGGLPVTMDAAQPEYRGGPGAGNDGFVARLSANGRVLEYCSYLGGTNQDAVYDVDTDPAGGLVVVGLTLSADFPVKNAFQGNFQPGSDAFVTRFAPDGALAHSSFLGGAGDSQAHAVAVDAQGNAFVTGINSEADFPFTGSIVGAGEPNVGFVARVGVNGALMQSIGLGTNYGYRVALDARGTPYVTGVTPGLAPAVDPVFPGPGSGAYVLALDMAVPRVVFGSQLSGGPNGNEADVGLGLALDATGNIFVCGRAGPGFMTTPGVLQPANNSGSSDYFVSRISAVIPPPAAPTNLRAVVYTAQLVELTWTDASIDETGFIIERRSHQQATFSELARTGSGMQFYRDETATPGSDYYYRVVAVRGTARSAPSNVATAVVPVGGILTLSPGSLALNVLLPGQEGKGVIRVRNGGGGPLALFVGTLPQPFQVDPAGQIPSGQYLLAARQSRTITVRFRPNSLGAFAATLTIWSTDPSRPVTQYAITGKTADGNLELTPRGGLLLTPNVGTTRSGTVTLRNGGPGLLTGSVEPIFTPFTVTSGVGAFQLAPGATRLVGVSYVAEDGVPDETALVLRSSDPDMPEVHYRIQGVPRVARASVEPARLDFGDVPVGTRVERYLRVKNIGQLPLTVHATAAKYGRFSIPFPSSFTLERGRWRDLRVQFNPIVAVLEEEQLIVSTTDPVTPFHPVTLVGHGFVRRPTIGIVPARVDFAATTVGQVRRSTITITNTGEATLQFRQELPVPAPFGLDMPGGLISLAPGRSREFTVTFRPTAPGMFMAGIELSTNVAPNHTIGIALSGEGRSP